MGMFSYICKGCGQELIECELVRLNGYKGEYDGYGRAVSDFGKFKSDGEDVIAWHERCYKTAKLKQRNDESPSRRAPDQGFGPAHLEFLPGYRLDAPCKYTVSVWGCTPMDLAGLGFDPRFEPAEQFDDLDTAIGRAHAFVIALRDGAPDVKLILNEYIIHVFGAQDPLGQHIEGMVYEFEREEICEYKYEPKFHRIRTGKYKESVNYRVGRQLIAIPKSSKPQAAAIMGLHGTPKQQQEAREFLSGHGKPTPSFDQEMSKLEKLVGELKVTLDHIEKSLAINRKKGSRK